MLHYSEVSAPVSLIQVKETNAVVLAGAYVDLHGASGASPENLSQVHQSENTPFNFT